MPPIVMLHMFFFLYNRVVNAENSVRRILNIENKRIVTIRIRALIFTAIILFNAIDPVFLSIASFSEMSNDAAIGAFLFNSRAVFIVS